MHHFLISEITIDPFAKFHCQHRETCQRHVVLLTLRITKCLYSNKILLKFIYHQKATKICQSCKILSFPNHQMPLFKDFFFKFIYVSSEGHKSLSKLQNSIVNYGHVMRTFFKNIPNTVQSRLSDIKFSDNR